MGRLRAGSCTVDITPPLGTPMAGYGDRVGVSAGVHDPLYASALVLDDGSLTVAIVTMDWIMVDATFTDQVRNLAAERCTIPPGRILLASSHTHSGPALRDRYGGEYSDPALTEVTARKVAGAIVAAAARLAEAGWGLGLGQASAIGTNRRDPGGPRDESVAVLRVEGPQGLIAAAYNFACHPTVLDYRNMLISADYPGAARAALAAVYGSEPSFLFLNGAAADISTRHLRRESSFAEATRFGRVLAGEVLRLLESTPAAPEAELRVARAVVQMPMRKLPDQAEAEARVAAAAAEVRRFQEAGLPPGRGLLRTAEVNLQGARATLGLVQRGPIAPVRAEFQLIALGDAAWFAVPGELFTEIGMAIKALAPGRRIQVVTYANDSIGYILTRAAHAEGGYEAGTARLAPEAQETVIDTARALLHENGLLEV
jgi:neutral ceramidase